MNDKAKIDALRKFADRIEKLGTHNFTIGELRTEAHNVLTLTVDDSAQPDWNVRAGYQIWLVVDELGAPIHCAGWAGACHEHINDAINEHKIEEAAKWKVHSATYDATPRATLGESLLYPARTLTADASEQAPDCCDTPSYCSSVRRCTAKDAERATPAPIAETELLPCAHCESAARIEDHRLFWTVECTVCGSHIIGDRATEEQAEKGTIPFWAAIRQSAIDRWNRRAT